MKEIILYKDWKTGEEKEYDSTSSSDIIRKTELVCPFDNTPILDRNYYHNGHDFFCPNCREHYPETNNQEEINHHAIRDALKCKDQLAGLEKTMADLKAQVGQAEKMGLISREK